MKTLLSLSLAAVTAASAAERPNILWITSEDISPYLGSYGCAEARTPHLDKQAEQGVRFTRNCASAPVCAVARPTLLTGMYVPTTMPPATATSSSTPSTPCNTRAPMAGRRAATTATRT